MRIGLLADIHGNAHALSAVLSAASELEVSRLLVAGDVVGHYYEPARCFEALRPWSTDWIRGNHEDLLDATEADAAVDSTLHTRYGSGFRQASATLDAATRDWIRTWPRELTLEIDGRRVRLCHGTPWSTDAYAYPDSPDETWSRMAAGGEDLVVFGHTHYRVDRRVGTTRLINPGSVGQARDGAGGACWAMYDTVTGDVTMRVERYDRDVVAMQARTRDPHVRHLVDVLYREKVRS